MEVEAKSTNGSSVELTEAESELYDRQIRLWGLESQKRLRTAKILISGLDGLGAEVTKNIILSGVNAVTLHDDKLVTEEDICAQFLLPRSAVGENRAEASVERARALNSMVEINADTEPLHQKNEEFFTRHDVIVIIGANSAELLRIDDICREHNIKFFAGDVWGMFGCCFADLQSHTFTEEVSKHKVISKPNEKIKTELVTSTVQRTLHFPSYAAVAEFDINAPSFVRKLKRNGPAFIVFCILRVFREEFKRNPSYKSREADIEHLIKIRNDLSKQELLPDEYFEYLFGQISPAAAIVGGILAQEVIKVISGKEAPNCNVFLFDPQNCCGFVETIGVTK